MLNTTRFIIGTLLFLASYLIVALPTNNMLLGILATAAALANRLWGVVEANLDRAC